MASNKLPGDSTTTDNGYPWWVYVIVILGTLLLAVGAVISKVNPSLLTGSAAITPATQVFADYTFARDAALVLMLVFLLSIKARRMLAGMMVLIALIQVLDMIDDLIRGDFALVPVVLVFAVVFFIGASKVFGRAAWHVDVWRTDR